MIRPAIAGLLGVFTLALPVFAASPSGWMLELTVRDRKIEGAPLTWNAREVVLLGRDGRIWQFAPQEAGDFRKTSDRFQGYSPSELRAALLRELGEGYEVSGTGHYLVAHPQGTRDQWAQRFEDLYRTFVGYFSVRGLAVQEPPFLLIGVVCRDRADFVRHASRLEGRPGRGVLGLYSTQTNRITLYDTSSGMPHPGRWQQNAATVIHEATHQMAFNTGVHSRYTPPPLWVAEGLATMFEVIGGSESGGSGSRDDRVHEGWLRQFRQRAAAGRRPEALAGLIAGDEAFRKDPASAYAEAWALTFYLVETQPRQYAEYLVRAAARPAFQGYSATQRLDDFTAVFGDDWRMLEARLLRFIEELK